MATKRYTDATKWSDPWFQELSKDYKFLWMYLLDKCDHAGIYRFSRKQLEFDLEISLDIEEMKKVFDGRVIVLDGEKWFIYKFVKFQYGQLNQQNSCHKSVIKILKEYGLFERVTDLLDSCKVVDTTLLPPMKGVRAERVGPKDKDQNQDNDQDNGTDKGIPHSHETADMLTAEGQLLAKAHACFGSSSPVPPLTDNRRSLLRLIRGDRRIGAERFIKACENRARAPDVPGEIGVDYFLNRDHYQERITKWAEGVPKYGQFSDNKKTRGIRSIDVGDGAPIPVKSASG